ncbi:MAG: hypothetical protein M1816_006180 [Peltula sp. TS41687]|nr:MAG: hypothetical protein M1816_006180 [Peltula sp. TS41687]
MCISRLKTSGPLPRPVSLSSSDTLKIILTTVEDEKPKRPHQAFLSIKDVGSDLGTSYAFNVKESGKAKIELVSNAHFYTLLGFCPDGTMQTSKDLPAQFWDASQPVRASVQIASFGDSKPFSGPVFDLNLKIDPNTPIVTPEKALRYKKLDPIHHKFRPDPKSAPRIITLAFTLAVLLTLPVLLGAWLTLGANLNHLPQALGRSPIAHVLFFGSIVALEGIFFMYYTSWNLFQTLPAALGVGSVAFLSGSRALSEVQERRLKGQR